jgi:hypothetical protein
MKKIITILALVLIPSVSFAAKQSVGMQSYSTASAVRTTCSAVPILNNEYYFSKIKVYNLGTKGFSNYTAVTDKVFIKCYQTATPTTAALVKFFIDSTPALNFPLTEKLFINLTTF